MTMAAMTPPGTATGLASTASNPTASCFTIQDANLSLQLILSHHGHPTLPLVVTHLNAAQNHLIATSPLHNGGPPSPATVAAVANATTALMPMFLPSTVPFSAPPLRQQMHHPPPPAATLPTLSSSMFPWSTASLGPLHSASTCTTPSPVAWLLQAHGSLQLVGRHHTATALASVDVFLVDALGKHPAQLLVSSRVPAAALPPPPMAAAAGSGAERAWYKASRM